jgi:hypothetical protein
VNLEERCNRGYLVMVIGWSRVWRKELKMPGRENNMT